MSPAAGGRSGGEDDPGVHVHTGSGVRFHACCSSSSASFPGSGSIAVGGGAEPPQPEVPQGFVLQCPVS
eukprot:13118528-Alexandrium_andersonii.AAC.1